MSDDPQNSIPEENSIPVSPASLDSTQDLPESPILDAPIPPTDSAPTPSAPVAPEAPPEAGSAVTVNNDNEQISKSEAQSSAPEPTAQIDEVEEDKVVAGAPLTPTAQMAGNEPLAEPETYKNHTHENLTKAQLTIQERKRKRLGKIIEALNTKGKITNDEVEKLLHVSDATATRYLEQLEKEGKIKQSGRTGQSVSYSRI